MKHFVYTAKDASGVLKRGDLEAPDRTTALESLKTKGWMPVSLTEGHAPLEKKRWLMPLAVAAFFVGVGCVVFWMTWSKILPEEKPTMTANVIQRTPEEKETQKAKEAQVEPELANAEQETLPEPIEVLLPPVQPKPQARPLAQTERPVRVLTPAESTNPPPRRAFSTGTEQLISWVANTRLGDPVPPLPMLPFGEDIEKILDTDIAVYDDDDEKNIQAKVNVAKMKQAMKVFIKEGGDPHDFLASYREELDVVYKERVTEQKELMRLYREEGAEQAQTFANTRNKELEARGIRPLALPPFLRK